MMFNHFWKAVLLLGLVPASCLFAEEAAPEAPRRVIIPTHVVEYGPRVPGVVGVINGSSPAKP